MKYLISSYEKRAQNPDCELSSQEQATIQDLPSAYQRGFHQSVHWASKQPENKRDLSNRQLMWDINESEKNKDTEK